MKLRNDLLADWSPEGLEVFQLTDAEMPASHVYMEAQIFTPDSRRLVLHCGSGPHGDHQPDHFFAVCDLDDGGGLTPVADEPGAKSLCVSPDGHRIYYIDDQTYPGGGRMELKRMGLDGSDHETIMVLDGPLPGEPFRVGRVCGHGTISSDGRRLAVAVFLGDGKAAGAPFGLLVFDLERAEVRLALHGASWGNMHAQYCRSLDPDEAHDIMVQENDWFVTDQNGVNIDPISRQTDQAGRFNGPGRAPDTGTDIHVIRDDGTNFRNLPWGRDGIESCQGHQCWRGRSGMAITSTILRHPGQPEENHLLSARPVPFTGHVGIASPGGRRNDLTRNVPHPMFYHFATDSEGRLLITDSGPEDGGGLIYLAKLPADEDAPLANLRPLLCPRSSWLKQTHIHPFLSPDGAAGFFNSDESGRMQAYMVRGWPRP